jgi:CBS-domain-containing membrane protein
MKIQDMMTRKVESCGPGADLAAAAMIMWRQDCGVVPVLDEQKRVVGVLTDRDICMAVATRHRRPEELRVRDVIGRRLFTARPEDDVRVALELMRNERVRRLPVVDAEKRLVGMVSINDVVLSAEPATGRATADLTANDVLETLKAICAHAVPMRVAKPKAELAHAG